ncbi:MAG: hypothetical protein ACOWWR_07290 [Eubacteriales bacterium]
MVKDRISKSKIIEMGLFSMIIGFCVIGLLSLLNGLFHINMPRYFDILIPILLTPLTFNYLMDKELKSENKNK